ncbi:MAG: hypothetical protein H7832_07495 [Magnetococcus sp. DMHC-6]
MPDKLQQMTLLIDSDHLQQRIQELAQQITQDLETLAKGELDPVLVVVLKGGFFFGADLLRAMARPLPVVFISARAAQQENWITQEDQALIQGRCLIVVDALMDKGGSQHRLLTWLESLGAREIRLAVLLHKTVNEAEPRPINYLGFEVPDVRLVGYGLDEDQRFRGESAIYTWWQNKEHDALRAKNQRQNLGG